ncbi:polysaccharide biosynthesis tyrosine autokinase [Rhodococcus sp. IEGM 1401]|uniref:polysaccharide biosynthesis tyrosine autokinase n=1 Tax=unclassified Rhodococcus (in: high G+C Gram-positive bacteria) TaxID=192944 RepID=UPI0022B4D412|nr:MULTISPECIES: polysaccharide biosynthesis tyrosine autokinase [unclassified Rhodococcus (in: high G+C Gram-positive bacteria)]MCZ4560891.1 polysaccharide biosynthesis tyrosine autokinase [Rhodococcus sp. IEGM 1401]MDI9921032.1 polysaccharide biosynthesis tyrosine autokinase [Rhodococcus sp. IEGM 1372]MDV8033368.1 polysaccharide biosynthesis tyrosine autokinase [Rhodococcus sp. IEGM 1414]
MDYLRAMVKRWYAVVAALAIGLAGGYAGFMIETPTYAATSQLFVSTGDQGNVVSAYQGNALAQQQASSFTALIVGQQVLSRTALQLGLEVAPGELAGQVGVTLPTGGVAVTIAATSDTSEGARDLADAVAENAIAYIGELQSPPGAPPSVVKVTQTEFAALPGTPIAPNLIRYLALGGGAGLVVGVAIAMLWFRLDNKVSSPKDAAGAVGAPLLGEIPRDRKLGSTGLVDFDSRSSATAEAFRKLRTRVGYLSSTNAALVVTVTSATPAEGRTTVALNLARAIAISGSRTVYVEGDLRNPDAAALLGIDGNRGLTQVLQGAIALEDAVSVTDEGLTVLVGGPAPLNPSELLGSVDMAAVIADLRSRFDYVVIDSPAALAVTDAAVISAHGDVTVVVVGLNRVSVADLESLTNSIPDPAGVIADFGKVEAVVRATDVPSAPTETKTRSKRSKTDRYGGASEPMVKFEADTVVDDSRSGSADSRASKH